VDPLAIADLASASPEASQLRACYSLAAARTPNTPLGLRFATIQAHAVEWLSDNGSPFTAKETLDFAWCHASPRYTARIQTASLKPSSKHSSATRPSIQETPVVSGYKPSTNSVTRLMRTAPPRAREADTTSRPLATITSAPTPGDQRA
jgi:hypothetical protein